MAKLNAVKPDTELPLTAQVEREIAAVAKRIRLNDLFTGAALLAVGTLSYAVVALLLDKWLGLPAWVRQLEFLGFVSALLVMSYFALVRPLMRVVNPRYVARQVEATMPQSKNELINWVDLQEREMPGAVKSALAGRAAAGFGDADVESAVRSRKFLWLGGAAAILFAALAVMFLLFKGTQFGSLLSRAFNPFQSTVIAARTTIDILEPTDPEATVADGEQIRFAVRLGGRVPDLNAPDKVRLKVRYSADAKDAEEIAFAKTDSLRDFELILTRGTIQNGFRYTVAAGDAETPERGVAVRTKPMLKDFKVRYQYPAYLRIGPSENADPKLRGYPGTQVTVEVKTNREVKAGSMMIEPRGEAVEAKIVGEKLDTLKFEKTLDRPGQFRIAFASVAGESSGASIPYPIEILADAPPAISIDKPAKEEITLSTDGLLEVDATVTDDFGIENTTLRFEIAGGPKIAGKKYLDAVSFQRDADGTFPTRVEYKDSVKLDQLKDEAGKSVALKAGQVLEFWLEAKDNCTVSPHELGKSKRYRANVVAPPAKPDEEKRQARQAQDRARQDEEHQKREKDKQAGEKREAPRDPNRKGEPGEKQPENGDPAPNDPKPPIDKGQKGDGMGKPDPEAEPMPNEKEVRNKADEVQNKIDEKNRQAGEGKANPNAEKPEGQDPPKTGEKKAGGAPPMDGAKESESKPGEGQENDPKAQPAGENKEPGRVKAPETSESKPEPNAKAGDESRPEAQPQGNTPKSAPKAEDKPGEEKKGQPDVAAPMESPKSGEKPKDDQAGGGKNEQPKGEGDPMAEGKPDSGKAKKDGAPKPGEQNDAPKAGEKGQEQSPPEDRPAEGKGQQPPEAGSKKPEKGGGKSAPPKDAGEQKPAPQPDADAMKPGEDAANNKGEGAKPADAKPMDPKDPMSGGGQDKNARGEEKPSPAPGEKKAKSQGGKQGDKPDAKQLEEAVKNLDSPDPATKKEAQDKLDKSVGKENREKAERMAKDLKSDDPKTRADAQKKLDEMADEAGKKGDQPQAKKPTKEELDELAKDAKDLNSGDADKKKAAEEKLDKSVGKENREKLQQQMKERDAANRKKLEDAAKQRPGENPGTPPKEPTKEELDELAKDAKDLNSGDADKKKAAEEKLDKSVGKENREKLQREMNGGETEDRKKLENDADQLSRKPKGPTKEDLDKLDKQAKDLNSPDEAKKKVAEQKLDEAVGKDARERMQQEGKEQAAAKATAEEKKAREAVSKAAKEQAERTPGAKPKEPTKEEVEQLAKEAKDLNSPDEAKKKAAEDKVDKAVGKEAREQLQRDMKALQGDDLKKSQQARERLEKMAKDMQEKNPSKDWRPGGTGAKGEDGKPLDDNPENRLKSAELQLDNFKKYRGDKGFQKEAGMSDADYEKFLKGYEEMVDRQRKELDDSKLNPVQARPKAASTVGANDGSAARVKGGTEAGTAPAAGGPSFAPPGFSDAQRDFAKEAREALDKTKRK